MKKFKFIEHTADIGLIAYGNSLPDAFANAACGMFSIVTDRRKVRLKESRTVKLAERDPESLLFAWLNELIYLFDTSGLLFKKFDVQQFDGRSLQAECWGEKYDRSRHEIRIGIKSATYHQLKVDMEKNQVQVIFDI